jgi:hypothetical protein
MLALSRRPERLSRLSACHIRWIAQLNVQSATTGGRRCCDAERTACAYSVGVTARHFGPAALQLSVIRTDALHKLKKDDGRTLWT